MYIIYSVDMKILTFFITNLYRKIYPASRKIIAPSLKKNKINVVEAEELSVLRLVTTFCCRNKNSQ